ncbi:hypothetical protein HD806DRAFT_180799 [Xylariaceae sp. AK1471]|nr:hypothetical protein HD806DRAFT_180799 [Xylariaceae sp. AK1471]
MADYSRMKVVELKAELKRLGLPQNGLKAELVTRLEEAAASEDNATATSDSPVEAETTAEPDEAQPSEGAERLDDTQDPKSANDTQDPELVDDAQEPPENEPTQEPQGEPTNATAQDGSGNDDGQAQIASSTKVSEVPSLPTAEVVQDVQKRKRRSTTPPPSDEVVHKRLRQDDQDVSRDAAALDSTSGSNENMELKNENTEQQPMPYVNMEIVQVEERTEKEPAIDEKEGLNGTEAANGVGATYETYVEDGRGATTKPDDSGVGDTEDSVMADVGATSLQRGAHSVTNETLDEETLDPKHTPSPERDIEPSIHPATCALYIKNFMRPLRPQAIQEHLLELATPANSSIDPGTIINFYLDNIRTHSFAVFTSISAASRVRTALHKRVWPDETNRKALWVDFIPPERFEDWVDTEQQVRDKGSMPRYEVMYDRDYDGNVIAKLEETDANQANRRAPASPIAHPDRKAPIPTGPSRPSGIENAPTGPRNPYSHNGPATMYSGRQDRLESGFLRTTSSPSVLYRPVAPELAQRRLDILAQAKDQRYNEESGRDYHRYYFERDVVLVDRGPEIFLGIRPPHREKERRELARTGGSGADNRDRNFRDRRGPPPPSAGGGRRRRRAPRPHGVPRGGDRFRPPGSSYDDRSAQDDRRPPRREGYGGSSRRKDSYRH